MGRPSLLIARASLVALAVALCVALTLGLPVGAPVLGPRPAAGLPDTCPGAVGGAVEVTMNAPRAGDRVSGVVEVTGEVRASADVFQVELFVGDSLRDRMTVDPPARAVDYDLSWDTRGAPAGARLLAVVACAGVPGEGRLSRGATDARVEVAASDAGSAEVGLAGRTLPLAPDRDRPRRSRLWIGVVMVVPGLVGLGYGLGAAFTKKRPGRAPA